MAWKRSLAGITAPRDSFAISCRESCRILSCERSWLCVPAGSAAWKHASQKRLRVRSSG